APFRGTGRRRPAEGDAAVRRGAPGRRLQLPPGPLDRRARRPRDPPAQVPGDLRDRGRPRRRHDPRQEPVRAAGNRAGADARDPLCGGVPRRWAAGPDDPALHRAGRHRRLCERGPKRGGAGRELALLPLLRGRLRPAARGAAAGRGADAAWGHPSPGQELPGARPAGGRAHAGHRRVRPLGRRPARPGGV
ncbi:MAG: hypothetical protein AVDCRST_MAG19-1946, partial [uncultured Thermomicrobiales bacterium]